MNKVKTILKRLLWLVIDSFAWFMTLCFIILGLGLIKYSLFGTIVTLLFAFFISPMRRKMLEKRGVKLKKRDVWIVSTILFFMSMYQVGNSDLGTSVNQEYEAEVVDVGTSLVGSEQIEEIQKEETDLVVADESLIDTEEIKEETVEPEETMGDIRTIESEKEADKTNLVNNTEESKDKSEVVVIEKEEVSIMEEKMVETANVEQESIESNLEVHFIDVGQGDATLFICDGEAMLLDAGTTSSGTSVQLYLKKRGVFELKYLILTHPDEDHIGGADVIVTKYNIDNVFMPSYERDTKAYEELINALEYKWYKWSTPGVGSNYSLGGATITVIAPNRNYDDVNESSMGILVTHGNNKFLFTGDAESEAESDITRNGINIDCNVFKAGHHGSRTSNSSELLKATTPEYVVVSCGEDNSYGHPHAGPMNEFRGMGAKLFRTDEQGTIVAESDGISLNWNMSPTDSWKAGEPIQLSDGTTTSDSERQSSSSSKSIPVSTPVSEPEPQTQPAGNNFAVNGKNGKIHIVGACSATGNGKQAMKQPVYFATFEEALERDIYLHSFDDNNLLNSGGHAVAGTIVIRTSSKLDEEEQVELTELVLASLRLGEALIQKDADLVEDTKIELPSVEIKSAGYEDVVKAYKDAGFNNVKAEGKEDNYDSKLYRENSVIEVAVNNATSSWEDKYDPEIPIIVYYRGFEEEKVQEQKKETEVISNLMDETVKEKTNIQKSTPISETETEQESQPQPASEPETKPAPQPTPAPEPAPVPEPTPSVPSGPSVTVPEHEESRPNLVWVPTKEGKKYHTGPGCSGMEDPMQVTVETATANGYTPCKRCH